MKENMLIKHTFLILILAQGHSAFAMKDWDKQPFKSPQLMPALYQETTDDDLLSLPLPPSPFEALDITPAMISLAIQDSRSRTPVVIENHSEQQDCNNLNPEEKISIETLLKTFTEGFYICAHIYPECKYTNRNLAWFSNHVNTRHDSETYPLMCDICGQRFSTEYLLHGHFYGKHRHNTVRNSHQTSQPVATESPIQKTESNVHACTHKDCKFTTHNARTFYDHETFRHDPLVYRYICVYCHERFKYSGNLQRHTSSYHPGNKFIIQSVNDGDTQATSQRLSKKTTAAAAKKTSHSHSKK